MCERDVGGWGRDPRKQKDFCITVKKDKNKKSHERWTYASVTALLVHGSRVTHHYVPFDQRMVTVFYLVQIEPKNGFETETVKDGYRLCGYLPQPPTSRVCVCVCVCVCVRACVCV